MSKVTESVTITILPYKSQPIKIKVNGLATIGKLKAELASLYKTTLNSFVLVCDNRVLQQYHLIKHVIVESKSCFMLPVSLLPGIKVDHVPRDKVNPQLLRNDTHEAPLQLTVLDTNPKVIPPKFIPTYKPPGVKPPVARPVVNSDPVLSPPKDTDDPSSVNQKLKSYINSLSQTNSYRFVIPNPQLTSPSNQSPPRALSVMNQLPPIQVLQYQVPIIRTFNPDGSLPTMLVNSSPSVTTPTET